MKTYNYDAFGNQAWVKVSDELGRETTASGKPQVITADTSYLYCAEAYASAIPQYYLPARCYNPVIGRFCSLENYEGGVQEPAGLQKYLYGRETPVSDIDPGETFTPTEILVN